MFLLLSISKTLACETCKAKESNILGNLTHGKGPESQWDFIISITAALIVLITLILSIKYLVRPGEKNPDHIKNSIITQNNEG